MSSYVRAPGETVPSRLMLVLSNGDFGGGQETVRLLAKHLDRTRYDVSVVCPPSPTMNRLEKLPHLKCFPMMFPTVPRPRLIRRLASLIRQERVDILHTHLFHGDLYGFLATRLVPVPLLVSTIQGINFNWRYEAFPRRARWWLASQGYRGIYRAFDRIATCSAALRDAVCTRSGLKIPRDRVRVIYNSVDVEDLKGSAEGMATLDASSAGVGASRPKRLITVANFARFKGHRILLQAMSKLPSDWTVECVLVGDGPERPLAEMLARDLGLMKRVHFLGYREDVPALLRQCDVLVLPSLWEPFGIALVEAMLLGVPVVACRSGGVPEIVTDGQTGILVPPGDADSLAAGIRRLLSNDALCLRLAAEARREAAARFDARAMAKRYQNLYQAI